MRLQTYWWCKTLNTANMLCLVHFRACFLCHFCGLHGFVQNCIGQFYVFCKKVFFLFWFCMFYCPTPISNPETLLVWTRPGLREINCSSSSDRAMVRLLGVHHRNVTAALSRMSPKCQSGASLWRLSVGKKRTDDLLPSIWNLVVQWWVEETWVSPLTILKWPEREWI
jgi:hypothetical protein